MASFLARLVERTGGTLPSNAPDSFDDDNGSVHESNINRLAATGVMTGTGNRQFSPSRPVARDEMATFVAKVYELRRGSPLPPAPADYFVDDSGNPHEADINRLAAVGIVSGKTSTQYDPSGTVPRDAMASFLARLLDKLVEDGVTRPPVQSRYLGSCNENGIPATSSSNYGCAQQSVNGTVYLKTLYTSFSYSTSSRSVEFDLSRDFTELTATLGLADDSGSTSQVRFEVAVDGVTKNTQTIGLGSSIPISVDVTGALRLRLTITSIQQTGSEDFGKAVFADPLVS